MVPAIQLASGAGDFSLTGIPADLAAHPITLAFGQSFSFGALFHPKDAGLDRGVVSITTNDPSRPTISVELVGTGLSTAKPLHWGRRLRDARHRHGAAAHQERPGRQFHSAAQARGLKSRYCCFIDHPRERIGHDVPAVVATPHFDVVSGKGEAGKTR